MPLEIDEHTDPQRFGPYKSASVHSPPFQDSLASRKRLSQNAAMHAPVEIGSEAHKELFCRVFLETHDRYKPAVIAWPVLAPDALQRLTSLPIWDIAVQTEGNAGLRMECFAQVCDDKLVAEAVAMNAFEERRHKEVLSHMIRFYGIPLKPEPEYLRPRDATGAFLRTGWGEIMDSFFAFGLFALAKRSGFFPPALVDVFEPVIQEEARHNLFFVNWLAWERRRRGLASPVFSARSFVGLARSAWSRAGTAKEVDGDNFTRTGGASIGIGLDAREFMALCLAEQERRLAVYDPRLLRPRLMPAMARLALRFMKEKPREALAAGE
jgi:hypothetical protein